ncbi:MAG: hypothetical protein HWN65_09170 [Candidatus Helarchaeota archaeon]|nr:hypothetical protein [Candidatus Helarchaeota archaeon]
MQRMALWIARQFGVDVDGLFWDLLYRELIRTELEINRENFIDIFKRIGGEAAIGSAERHKTIMKLFAPKTATDVMGYIQFIWSTVFSEDIEMSEELEQSEDGKITKVTLKVDRCPICQGFGDDAEDFPELIKETIQAKGDGYACILLGMIEGLSNYIFKLRNEPYKVKIREIECIALGGKQLVFEALLTELET